MEGVEPHVGIKKLVFERGDEHIRRMSKNLEEAANQLLRAIRLRPRLGVVLGSAFGGVVNELEVDSEVQFDELPGMPSSSVKGHAGKFVVGRLAGLEVLVQAGRLHYYEGHSMEVVTFPVRLMAAVGVQRLVLTNAAGGISDDLIVGDFMQITDHINLMGENPLRGTVTEGRTRFVDMADAYSAELGQALGQAAERCGVSLKQGVYLAVSGPSYETPAEIGAFAKMGADAVGMSTVPETIVARQCGMEVLGLSCITNAAAGKAADPITHEEVLAASGQASRNAAELLNSFCEFLRDADER